jgi:hypothetical protein
MDLFLTNILLGLILFVLILKIVIDSKYESLEDFIELVPHIWRTIILILIPFLLVGLIGFILSK